VVELITTGFRPWPCPTTADVNSGRSQISVAVAPIPGASAESAGDGAGV
jgi:hypothetical protein